MGKIKFLKVFFATLFVSLFIYVAFVALPDYVRGTPEQAIELASKRTKILFPPNAKIIKRTNYITFEGFALIVMELDEENFKRVWQEALQKYKSCEVGEFRDLTPIITNDSELKTKFKYGLSFACFSRGSFFCCYLDTSSLYAIVIYEWY
jgi:hypothetical protein